MSTVVLPFSVSTKELLFSDVLLYVAARQSLRKFLESFKRAGLSKGYFPYARLNSLESLALPISHIQYDDFKAQIGQETGRNQLDADHRKFRSKYKLADPKERIVMKRPPTGQQVFTQLKVGQFHLLC